MFKRFIRWILPLVVLALIGMFFVLSPMLAIHAAGPVTPSHIIVPHILAPDVLFHW
jgi:hypothetical protein